MRAVAVAVFVASLLPAAAFAGDYDLGPLRGSKLCRTRDLRP